MASPTIRRQVAIIVFPDEDEPTFLLFPKLPLELRRMIFDEASRLPRVITVSRTKKLVKVERDGNVIKLPIAQVGICDAYPPPILHVSKDARETALKYYEYAFHGRLKNPIYFNFAVDYLHFENGYAIPVFENPYSNHGFGAVNPTETRRRVQHVILGPPVFDRFENYRRNDVYAKIVKYHIGRYKALKVLLFEAPRLLDADVALWCLSGLMEPVRRKWGNLGILGPRNTVLVPYGRLNSLVEDEEHDFESVADGTLVRPATTDTGVYEGEGNRIIPPYDNTTVDSGSDDFSDDGGDESSESSDESSDES